MLFSVYLMLGLTKKGGLINIGQGERDFMCSEWNKNAIFYFVATVLVKIVDLKKSHKINIFNLGKFVFRLIDNTWLSVTNSASTPTTSPSFKISVEFNGVKLRENRDCFKANDLSANRTLLGIWGSAIERNQEKNFGAILLKNFISFNVKGRFQTE